MDDALPPVRVSRRIKAPAGEIFQVLTDPARHLDLDGSGMVRGAVSSAVVRGVGDVFVIAMYYSGIGEYEMNNHVVQYAENSLIGWEPEAGKGHPDEGADDARWGHRWSYELVPDGTGATVVTEIYDCSALSEPDRDSMEGGRTWISSMTATLRRLDRICTGGSADDRGRADCQG